MRMVSSDVNASSLRLRPVPGRAVFDRGAYRGLVVRRFRDRDGVVFAEREVYVDELPAPVVEPLWRRGDTLIPILDRLEPPRWS